jgi:pyruvate/2-oxoglutarate dehydrogenase complex dihydrolipoamide dehydrogenase (E3) component
MSSWDVVVVGAGSVDASAALAQRSVMTSHWDDSWQLPWPAEHGVDLVRGTARLDGPRRVVVTDDRASAEQHTAERAVVLATGTTAAIPPIPGLAEAAPWDNRDATAAKSVPRRLLVLGGGAVGVELAQAFRRLGSDRVVVIEGAERPLAREEPFAGAQVRAALEAEGVQVLLGARVSGVRRAGRDGPVLLELEDGTRLEGDELLVATGRRVRTDLLGLETVGVTPGRVVDVDDTLRVTGVDGGWLYAVGDVNGRAQLTHMGKYQARVATVAIAGAVHLAALRHAVPAFPTISEVWVHLLEQYVPVEDLRHA